MSVRKNSDGTWFVRGKCKNESDGYTYYFKSGFKRKTDASNWEKSQKLQIQSCGSALKSKDYNLDTVFDWYITSGPSTVGKAASTFNGERKRYRKWIQPYLGRLQLDQITSTRIQEWWQTVIFEVPISSQYKRSILTALSNIFTFLIKQRICESNPVKNAILDKPKYMPPKKDGVWTPHMVNSVISHGSCPDFDQLIFFLYWTGLRIGEARALKWKDIDFERKTLQVSRTMSSVSRQNNILTNPPKSLRSTRTINLQAPLIQLLTIRKKRTDNADPEEWVFGHYVQKTRDVQPFSLSYFWKYFGKLQELVIEEEPELDLPRIPVKGLRSSHASWLILNHIDDQIIADRMGHSVRVLRSHYAHIFVIARSSMASQLIEEQSKIFK